MKWTPIKWIGSWIAVKRNHLFWNMHRDATAKAIASLQDDLVMYMEPKSLYEKGWNDAMKSVSRTLKNYHRCGVID